MVRALVVAFALVAVACRPEPRIVPAPAAPAAGVKGKRVAIKVAHEGASARGGKLEGFDEAMLKALRESLEEAGLEVVLPSAAEEATLDVNTIVDSPVEMIGDRAIFRYTLAKSGRGTVIHTYEETSIAPDELSTELPRAAAKRITNEVVTASDTVDILARFANPAFGSVDRTPPGMKSVLAMPMRASTEVKQETLDKATEKMNGLLDARTIFKMILVKDLSAGTALSSTVERDVATCSTTACIAQIGKSINVDHIGYGVINTVGKNYGVTYVTVESATGHVIAKVTRTAPQDDEKLLAVLDALAADVADQWSGAAHVKQ